MNSELCESSVVTSNSLGERFITAFSEASRAGLHAFQAAWRDHSAQHARATSLDRMADIDAHTLKDIGAPNWLIAQAVERKDARHRHMLDLYWS